MTLRFFPFAPALIADAMGATALKAELKEVVLACDQNAASYEYDRAIQFKDGRLGHPSPTLKI